MAIDIFGKKGIFAYLFRLIDCIPHQIYVWAAIILCIGSAFFLIWKGLDKGRVYTIRLLLTEYVGLIYCSTVIFRKAMKYSKYNLHPLWSYNAIDEGKDKLIPEIFMNAVMFLPVGLLLGIAFRDIKWWMILLIGVFISVSIETLQFVYVKGYSEIDDVMHNTFGCLMGWFVIKLRRES